MPRYLGNRQIGACPDPPTTASVFCRGRGRRRGREPRAASGLNAHAPSALPATVPSRPRTNAAIQHELGHAPCRLPQTAWVRCHLAANPTSTTRCALVGIRVLAASVKSPEPKIGRLILGTPTAPIRAAPRIGAASRAEPVGVPAAPHAGPGKWVDLRLATGSGPQAT